jgi:4-aminobutyrate aminotransferase-like enzyme
VVTNAVTASALRLAPPLTVSDDEIDEAVVAIASVLQEFLP